jgi:hypothetical protein
MLTTEDYIDDRYLPEDEAAAVSKRGSVGGIAVRPMEKYLGVCTGDNDGAGQTELAIQEFAAHPTPVLNST